MAERNQQRHRRWSPRGECGPAETMGPDAILAGAWLSDPANDTRQVDLFTAYRALMQENMAGELFSAGTTDLAASLAKHPRNEHLSDVRITFSDGGQTVVLGPGETPAPDKRLVDQLCAELTLLKAGKRRRTMRVPAEIAFLGERSKDGFLLDGGRPTAPAEAVSAMQWMFEDELASCYSGWDGDNDEQRLYHLFEEETVRILEGEDAATLRRIANAATRTIAPSVPAGRRAWVEVTADGSVSSGLR